MTQNSNNTKITNNADGFDQAGGTTARKLTVTGADITLTGTGTNVYTFPASTSTLFGTADAIPNTNSQAGITNMNSAAQSQVTVAGTKYYITNSALTMPATTKTGGGMSTSTRMRWTIALTKTAAGTGAFQFVIYRGTNGSTADTADVTQSIGTQSAAVDNMIVDIEVVVTATGATGSYYWSIIPNNKAITATGFGVATGAGAYFSGTVSSVAMNTASLIFGIGFSSVTGTPTIVIPLVDGKVYNMA